MTNSPIEQFKVNTIGTDINVAGLDISFSNSSLAMLFTLLIIMLLFYITLKRSSIIPNRLQMSAEIVFDFVSNMVKENMEPEGKKFFTLIFSLFLFILIGNVLSLLPYVFSFTAQPAITMFIAVFIFLLTTIYGIYKHGFKFLKLFIPDGIPIILLPIMFVIEIISYLAKSLTLGIRLFANIMSGHILLEIIAGFIVLMGVFGIIPLAFTSVLFILEFAVACLQAYALSILACLYINQAISLH